MLNNKRLVPGWRTLAPSIILVGGLTLGFSTYQSTQAQGGVAGSGNVTAEDRGGGPPQAITLPNGLSGNVAFTKLGHSTHMLRQTLPDPTGNGMKTKITLFQMNVIGCQTICETTISFTNP